jgi:hypothetical protein
VKRSSVPLAIFFLSYATAYAQETVIHRRGDGTTVVPGEEGPITITTKTVGVSPDRIPRRLDPRELDKFLKDRRAEEAAWT